MHRRPGLGDRHLLRHHLAADRTASPRSSTQAEFDAERWYRILQDQQVTVWYTAPTAIRMLMKAGAELAAAASTCPACASWPASASRSTPRPWSGGIEALGLPFHDNWWQTETGGIMIANYPGDGRASPDRWAARCRVSTRRASCAAPAGRDGAARSAEPDGRRRARTAARLAIDVPRLPHEDERYRKCFAGGWYLTGDLARRDADGYFWFVGRADDVIKTRRPPHRPVRGRERADGAPGGCRGGRDRHARTRSPARWSRHLSRSSTAVEPSEALRKELLGHARGGSGPAVAPEDIDFRQNLPKTRSGKIMRRLLKARELGLPEGDISTLESEER